MEPIERKLIAVLCADVKDYSQHMQRDEDGTIRRLHDYRLTFDQSIKDHHGRTARSRTSGEYLLVVFMTPSSQELESPANPGRFIQNGCVNIRCVMQFEYLSSVISRSLNYHVYDEKLGITQESSPA
jgi:class 3 adenylate cyclase